MEINGKTVLITGGSAGIGLEATKQFFDNGAKVIITGRNQEKLDKAKRLYPSVIAIKSDVSNENDALSLFKKVEELGGIDILYNNAGVTSSPFNLGIPNARHFERATYEININYLGLIRLNNIFMKMLKSRKEAAIINTSSILSYLPSNLSPTYSASKAAVRFYTESLRSHLQILNSNIKVFELLPPLVETDMTKGLDAKKLTPEYLIKELIAALSKDQYTIRVGDTKFMYFFNRLFPKTAFNMLNQKKFAKMLQS